jgi:hypothetical protein
MNSYPVLAGNITQTLYQQNEKQIVPNDSFELAYKNLHNLSDINVIPQENTLKEQMPAYIKQAHLSTWYQDNPWETLTFSKKYGLPTMGGNIDPNLPPGHQPGNTLRAASNRKQQQRMSVVDNMKNSPIMKENFENYHSNLSKKINWQ